ncbi:fatty acid synthase-like isoform X2 [Aricia agestis]|uniref:fatty acid synthase-like isoform X2 n=1 Tax=Aricia agestis TaxID=91739 RepID=UPI001C207585|nr:fatty acid synthase-like isoform X2 [Aricia agestis]
MNTIPGEQGECERREYHGLEVTGDHVVISGMSGLYPKSRNIQELHHILYNKINPAEKTERWSGLPEVSQYVGQISELEYFDAQFFKVHHRLSNLMDPMSRKLLEQSYQAIFDAGCSPGYLAGKKVGVFIGICFTEADKVFLYTDHVKSGLGITGCNRSMCANRISYYLNLKGPSMSVDQSCASSTAALEMAYDAMIRGECEAAIVGGSKLCLHSQTLIGYGRILLTCKDGKTKSFDANADGCCKSEAINCIFLQKAKDALRIYARVVHVKTEFMSLCKTDIGAVAGFDRDPADITRFLGTFYKEADVSPLEVQYVEAFGAGNRDSDKRELEAIDEFFCKGRRKPLPVGSVMSNIGYVESASGLSSVTKILLGYQCGKLAANLHYNTPRDDIAAIKEGRIEILAEHKDFVPTYTAINSISMTGPFGHILLHGFSKKKDIARYKIHFPRLVLSSGRQESAVQKIFTYLKSKPVDPEELTLIHHFYENNITGHLGRGFLILDTDENKETVCLSSECAYFDQARRPLWFVYSGMGSQWPAMGKDLMRIPVFAAAIQRCHRVLEPKGLNIVDIITSDDPKTFDNILHSFVGITAIQIGLTDVLRAMDIAPDMIIGHSLGEIGCAYADNCFTAEETIMCAYSRGLVSVQTPFIRGSMAAIGLGYKEISRMCPPEIEVACHNSAESCTISGPAEIMSEFVLSLTRQGIFAKEVPCSNIAFHSRYIANAGHALLKFMEEIVPNPKPRSSRWLSTSVPQAQWDEPKAKYCSADYFTNNLLSPVLFEETSQQIPADAVLVEVAPHNLLQAILKRSLPQSCKLLPLSRRGHPANTTLLLETIGRLYVEGFNPKVKALYPRIEFPVSTSTPMLSHLVEWVHNEEWSLHKPTIASKAIATTSKDAISTFDVEHSHLKGHIIRGKNLYPFSAALVAVWDTLAASLNKERKTLSVQFENVYSHTQPILNKKHQLRLYVGIQKGTGHFEVLNENSVIITGTILPEITDERKFEMPQITAETHLDADDIYQLLHAKDYHYVNEFRSIHSVNESLTEARIAWRDNWTTFLEGIIQLNVLRRQHHAVSKINLIRKMIIDVDKHRSCTMVDGDTVLVKAKVLDVYDLTVCGGVIMETVKFIDVPPLKNDDIVLKMSEFLPLFSSKKMNENKALNMLIQIAADNVKHQSINIMQIENAYSVKNNFSNIKEISNKIPGISATYTKACLDEKDKNDFEHIDLIIAADLNDEMCQKLQSVLHQNTFIIYKQGQEQKESSYNRVVSAQNTENGIIKLAIWRPTEPNISKKLILRQQKDSQDTPGGEYFVPLEDETNSNQSVTLKIAQIGDLQSIYWAKDDLQTDHGVKVKATYVGINIVYVNKLLGTHFQDNNEPTKCVIDFSGFAKSGARVMGLVRSDTISSHVTAQAEFLLPVPNYWTLEDAATVPLAYSLAFYILFIKVRMNRKHTICVHGGTGALGQAVISIALAHGCRVFATVSNRSKKLFLKKIFPQVKDSHIIDHSRDLNFVYNIMRETNGKGCNLLVSCATDELKNYSFRCLASYGVMVDTSVVPNREDYKFGLDHLSFDKVYYPIDFSTIFLPQFSEDIQLIRELMVTGIRQGYVRPLTRVTYEARDAARACRLQTRDHHGRVLLQLNMEMNVVSSITCSNSSWQLLVSDNQMLALKLAERLVERGATKILMLLDKVSNYVHAHIRQWEDDVTVRLIEATREAKEKSDIIRGCKEDGLESIFILTSKEKATHVMETVEQFTTFVSKYSYPLKYFALVTTSKLSNTPRSWFTTNGNSKMITKIKLPEIKQINNDEDRPNNNSAISANDAIDALERALCSREKDVLVHKCNATRKTLMEQILSLAGLKVDSEEARNSNYTLRELNMSDAAVSVIQEYLKDAYELSFSVEDLLNLSVESNELENRCVDSHVEENRGIATYFPTVFADELLHTTDLRFMPTLASTAAFTDVDVSKPHLCIVPGVEGYHERFSALCERLKLPVLALQPGIDNPSETISELAHRYIAVIKKKAALNDHFYLLGYESGILVALEMAAVLEKYGLTGTVFCIGGTPTEVIDDFKSNLIDFKTDAELQVGVLKHAYSLFTKEDSSVIGQLTSMEWPTKLSICVSLMRGKTTHSMQYIRKWIEYMYKQLSTLVNTTHEINKISSQIISLRPRYPTSVDTSLQECSEKKVVTYQLESPLCSAHLDMMCATIINSHLDRDILETFKNRNICDSYRILGKIVTF